MIGGSELLSFESEKQEAWDRGLSITHLSVRCDACAETTHFSTFLILIKLAFLMETETETIITVRERSCSVAFFPGIPLQSQNPLLQEPKHWFQGASSCQHQKEIVSDSHNSFVFVFTKKFVYSPKRFFVFSAIPEDPGKIHQELFWTVLHEEMLARMGDNCLTSAGVGVPGKNAGA